MGRGVASIVCLFACAVTTTAHAAPKRLATPLDDLGDNIVDAFTGSELAFYAGGVLVTGAMAFGGTDHAFRVQSQRLFSYEHYSGFTNYAGYVLPVVIGPTLYLTGVLTNSVETAGAGSAVIQAVAVTLTTTAALKLAAGRPFPLHGGDPRAVDRLDHPEYAREFRPFQLDIAWPSGHTSGTTSIAAALTGYFPNEPLVPLLTYPLAVAVGIGMVAGDHHWTSDVIAGGLLGHAIGYSIGRNFHARDRERRQGQKRTQGAQSSSPRAPELLILPLPGARYGASLLGFW